MFRKKGVHFIFGYNFCEGRLIIPPPKWPEVLYFTAEVTGNLFSSQGRI